MNIAFNPIHPGVDVKSVAGLYEKNTALGSITKASDWFADIDKIDDLKKVLLLAINCGNFDKAIYILEQLKALHK